jgi:2-hydroxymuconate-semialdehyde hydrolase
MPMKEYDVAFEGTNFHCYEGGKGFPLLMIHGSGPGTASATNWAYVMKPLSRSYHVLAMDLIGYGKSGRKPREPYFDMMMWVRQTEHMLKRLAPSGPAGIIGHSMGGAIALMTALANPRVGKLVLQGSLGAQAKINRAIAESWVVPKDEVSFRRYYKDVIKIRTPLSDEFVRDRITLLKKDGYDQYFNAMFDGDKQKYLDKTVISRRALAKLKSEVTMIHGAEDTCVPFEEGGIGLAALLPRADLVRLADCGHPCSFDQPRKFIAVVKMAIG